MKWPASCRNVLFALLCCVAAQLATAADKPAATDYAAVDAIFSKHCLDCHASQDPEAKLVLESFESVMKGGESGQVVLAGNSHDSLLVQMVEGKVFKDGKNLIMPPGRKRQKLKPAEIALITAWIDAGAHPPAMAKSIIAELDVPQIKVKGVARNPINALAHVPGTNLVAVARYREVELRSSDTGKLIRTLKGHHGNVNALAFSPNGKRLFAGSGENVRYGEIKEWNVANGKLIRTFLGHKDTVYSLAVSPDGKILASGSYDQKIILWDIATGKERNTLSGHNGCVFGLAFRPDGKILASASGDHTVKLWDVAGGTRRDTLSQPLKDVYAVAFSPDGKKLMAGGVDHRIRIWSISATAAETTNPLLDSKFAHDGSILRLVFSPDGKMLLSSADDRTVRLWDTGKMKERLLLEKQPDWATGLDFARNDQAIAVGRLDGSLAFYDLAGKSLPFVAAMAEAPAEKPSIARLQPRGMQRGTDLTLKVIGGNLLSLTNVKSSNPKLAVSLSKTAKATSTEAWIDVKAAPDLPRGLYDISVINANGESGPGKIYIGHLPHVFEAENNPPRTLRMVTLPMSYWGDLNPGGDVDELEFHAQAGQSLVFDLSAKSIGSKAQAQLSLLDAHGEILSSEGEFEGGDPLLAYTITSNGLYRIRIAETTEEGSPDYFYRLTMGELPQVISIFPPSVQTNREAEVQLIGYNLTGKDKIKISPMKAGELEVPLNSDTYRARRAFKVLVTDGPELVEAEPNDTPGEATPIPVPSTVSGRIFAEGKAAPDVDLYRFEAKAGQKLIIETDAARRGSPIDTKIEVLYADGRPVPRLQLQAVRDSAINFRAITSSQNEVRIDNWEEMELNQYLYMQGEVCKLFRMPQGPDSGFQFYTVAGQRRDYFDSSGTDHALDEPCYIVEPHPPGEKLQPNGLPVFPLYYANDDDGDRQLGVDSRLHFTAPSAGSYLIRVTDNRGRGGARFFYRLIVREPHPDFVVTLNGADQTLNPGTGREFTLTANRTDAFDEDIQVDITNIRARFSISTPVVIQAGHSEAKGTLNCDTNAVTLTAQIVSKIKITASAMVGEKKVEKPVNSFAKIAVGAASKLLVACEPYNAAATNFVLRSVSETPLEITVAPGQIVPAWIKVSRHGYNDLITFTADNLPHGVIVDNIGLNGVLIPKDENRRQIFLRAAKWVPDTDRLFYVKAAQEGGPTSLPVLLHVRRPVPTQTASFSLTLPRR
ncbi:MAG TPA: c-type cytochrome domain-containing protein [Candidatus Saccharimonadales bacterium]|nr:c-type cytochrome domain-containing protein [Candidatus Saccharimonadales bacterium]